MPFVVVLQSGRGDGIPPVQGTTGRVPSLALLGVGNLIPVLVFALLGGLL